METRGWGRKASQSRDMFSILEIRVVNLEESIRDVKEALKEEAQSKLHQLTQQDTVREYVQEFVELLTRLLDLNENEAFYWFKDGLKPWVTQKLHRLKVKVLTKVITKVESFSELGPRKNKFESSKPKYMGNYGGKPLGIMG
ncbi:hypothetical protein J1N35_001552 [Gossypium stocksii]|uniref:Retrotransposon gag domain-containing protein n=1 Tax=Gossypium stocksii TaxID=47602 RepID=A0A9D4AMC3_9ROSI|nr:hypothetical protein J1N35_001552 [Gossypium stocksii]